MCFVTFVGAVLHHLLLKVESSPQTTIQWSLLTLTILLAVIGNTMSDPSRPHLPELTDIAPKIVTRLCQLLGSGSAVGVDATRYYVCILFALTVQLGYFLTPDICAILEDLLNSDPSAAVKTAVCCRCFFVIHLTRVDGYQNRFQCRLQGLPKGWNNPPLNAATYRGVLG